MHSMDISWQQATHEKPLMQVHSWDFHFLYGTFMVIPLDFSPVVFLHYSLLGMLPKAPCEASTVTKIKLNDA